LIGPSAGAFEQDPPAETTPATQPTPAELMAELRLLREQMRQQQEHHEAELRALQAQIDELKERGPGTATATAPATAPAATAEQELEALLGGAAAPAAPQAAPPGPLSLRGAVQSFNPDISVNADFLAAFSNREGGTLDDEFLFRELEMSISGAVDAYTRADFFITLEREDGEFGVDLEEGYLTFLALPHNLQARLGKFRADFGRANAYHRHALPWVDYPLVIKRFFGEEGLSGTGGELSWLVPNPWHQYVSLTYEVFNNDNDTLFAGEDSDDFAHLVRLKTSRDLSTTSNFELGASFATAPSDGAHGGRRSMVEGVDVTYRWRPKEAGLYRAFLWQTEALFAQVERAFGEAGASWGMYTAGEYQFARRWKFGLRYDMTDLPGDASRHEQAYSAYLTFLQSEFAYWRLGYQFTDRNFAEQGNKDEHQVFLQLNWNLGVHPAHKF
jgi:hypothetical protein